MYRFFLSFVILLFVSSPALADAVLPTADKEGSRDDPRLKRYEGSFIISFEQRSFDAFQLPLARLAQVPGRKDNHNNHYFEPGEKKSLEGSRTRLVYLLPEKRTPLEVLRNYQQEIKEQGGDILFECSGGECGGDPGRSSAGGGGEMSLAMYLMPQESISDPVFSNGHCAMTERINDQRYTAAELPASGLHVSVLTYTLKGGSSCKAFKGRTIAIVDLIEAKAREQKMVTVKAEEMEREIAVSGSIALYGIYFDFDQAVVKPESQPTLQEIAQLLKNKPELKLLIAGHTDNVGSFVYNMDLSQRRAAAVVQALTSGFGIDRARLTPVGVSSASPKATNRSEEGRAKNRRVELVEN
ncbi:MAG: OmpA family protein [Desulfobulbaceae bacterium]|nr:OmpA family protein [Desulfobulbaceae bacterium]